MPGSNIRTDNALCAICRYPIMLPASQGQTARCPNCGTINESITQVTIPTPVFVGFVAFAAGVLLGPAILAASDAGSEYMARRIRERIG